MSAREAWRHPEGMSAERSADPRPRRACTINGTATATASAASSHHNQEGTAVVVPVEPVADDKVVGDGDGVGVGHALAVAVTVALGGGLTVTVAFGGGFAVTVTVATGGGLAVAVGFGKSVDVGDSVGFGIVAVEVGISVRTGDRVGLGIVAVAVGRSGDRVGVADGRSDASHEISTRAATTSPAARITCGTALPNPALVVPSPPLRACLGWRHDRPMRTPHRLLLTRTLATIREPSRA
jgi:hypothetical protein